ncbi:hypothetical protein [Azorhizobium sp. AG788]|uniref:hypothetical protein n=1 Tax=Azorhizobium sp. AG788 TaxID=2183897 RepID=UPI00313A3E6A
MLNPVRGSKIQQSKWTQACANLAFIDIWHLIAIFCKPRIEYRESALRQYVSSVDCMGVAMHRRVALVACAAA